MTLHMDIQVADDLSESIEEPPPRAQLIAWAQAAWQGAQDAEPEVSLRIVSAAESQQLNHTYRGKNKPTNVLSFPMQMEAADLPADIQLDTEAAADWQDMSGQSLLGDLAICAQVVAEEAQQQNKPVAAHWAHMIVHGMLHLQGYDHIENAEAEQMEQLEAQIMQGLGFSNPYLPIDNQMNNSSVTERTHERNS